MKLTSTTISKLMIGSNAALKAYLGSTLVWTGGYTIIDTDAQAYVTAVATAGATVTDVQKAAIDTFVIGEKAASRWTQHGRLYLPIWGVAAANAICMKSLTSGTFVGGVTHGAGFVQGDASTGYFNTGTTLSTAGHTTTSGSMFYLSLSPVSGEEKDIMGTADTTSRIARMTQGVDYSKVIMHSTVASAYTENSLGPSSGVHLATRTGTSLYMSSRRSNGGYNQSVSTKSITAVTNGTVFVMARRGNSIPFAFNDVKLGMYGLGVDFGSTNAESTVNALITLWHSCTGLTTQ